MVLLARARVEEGFDAMINISNVLHDPRIIRKLGEERRRVVEA
jgi:hypothetical protein